jgi:hypothetical protein
LRTNGALPTAIPPKLTTIAIPDTVLTMVALITVGTTTINFFLPIVENLIITIGWYLVVFV